MVKCTLELEDNPVSSSTAERPLKKIKIDKIRLPIESANIQNVIDTGYYVDKTEHAYDLLMEGPPQAKFLIRPRRFGKTLFINTLTAIAHGERELFAGREICIGDERKVIPPCFIYDRYDWSKKYPVIHLNLSDLKNCKTPEELMLGLNERLYKTASDARYNVASKLEHYKTYCLSELYLEKLIDALAGLGGIYQNQVVVLIDEYDAPLLYATKSVPPAHKTARKPLDHFDVIKSFFNEIKQQMDAGKIKLEFVTGVTRFSLSDLGSGPNNLSDITIDREFATVAGYKAEDVLRVFGDRVDFVVQEWQRRRKLPKQDNLYNHEVARKYVLQEMIKKYNGYKFYEDGDENQGMFSVFNPLSVMKFLSSGYLDNYWSESGSPERLIDQMRQDHNRFDLDFDNVDILAEKKELKYTLDSAKVDIKSLMFQTGYLTIDSYDEAQSKYHLKYPNQEVKESLQDDFIRVGNETMLSAKGPLAIALDREVWQKDFFDYLYHNCFPNLPYSVIHPYESYCQGLFQIALLGGDLKVLGEVRNNTGSIDTVIETAHKFYIFELKLNGSASDALQQIQDKNYARGYFHQGKNVVWVGLNFVHTLCNGCQASSKQPGCTACKQLAKHPNHNNIDGFATRAYDSNGTELLDQATEGAFCNGHLNFNVIAQARASSRSTDKQLSQSHSKQKKRDTLG